MFCLRPRNLVVFELSRVSPGLSSLSNSAAIYKDSHKNPGIKLLAPLCVSALLCDFMNLADEIIQKASESFASSLEYIFHNAGSQTLRSPRVDLFNKASDFCSVGGRDKCFEGHAVLETRSNQPLMSTGEA